MSDDNPQPAREDDESYDAALDALLNSPLHQSRTKEALQKAAARRKDTLQDMNTYLQRISLVEGISKRIRVVHITGTKGKGSTCSMVETILRQHYGLKTGLFTSPHLVDIRERIRINGLPVSPTVFAKAYWTIRKRLEQFEGDNDEDELPLLPGYFRMMALMALFVFSHYQPELDVIILEVGMGGRYDATNILNMEGRHVVCGVTLLDLDHVRVLGDTLEQIAWEKGGIFQATKVGTPPASSSVATTESKEENNDSQQPATFFAIDTNTPGVLEVLEKCAKEEGKGRTLKIVGKRTGVVPEDAVLGLKGDHQRINAELAVHVCQAIAETYNDGSSDKKRKNDDGIFEALANASWPGRCQTVELGDAKVPTLLRLDGAHTPISVQAGFDWFCSASSSKSSQTTAVEGRTKRIMIFNTSHERNPVQLLQILLPSSSDIRFEKAFFCRSDVERPSAETKKSAKDLLEGEAVQVHANLLPDPSSKTTVTWQMTLEAIWKHLEAAASVSPADTVANLTVKEALDQIRTISGEELEGVDRIEVFVIGSLLLVGSSLSAIGWSEQIAEGELKL